MEGQAQPQVKEVDLGYDIKLSYQCNGYLCYACINNTARTFCGYVHPGDIEDIKNVLMVPYDIAEKINDILTKDISTQANGIYIGSFYKGTTLYSLYRNPHAIIAINEKGKPLDIYLGYINAKIIKDKYIGSTFYILETEYNKYISNELGDIISDFISNDQGITEENMGKPLIRTLFRETKPTIDYVYQGFYPDGWHDGVLPYPLEVEECNPHALEELIAWVKGNYSDNRTQAYANIALAMGKVYTPAIRMTRIFEDRIVFNTGPRRVGKTELQRKIVWTLGLSEHDVRVVGDNALKTQERLRNLLNITQAPLFLDELMTKGISTIADTILAIATELGKIGLHAARTGIGFSNEFYSVRSIMLNTNLPEGEIIKILGKDNIDAYSRRVLFINWDNDPFKRGSNMEVTRGLIGCLRDMWQDLNIRNDILKSESLFEEAMKTVKYFSLRYNIDTTPLQEAIINVYNEFMSNESRYDITPEEVVIQRAIEITTKNLLVTNVNFAKVIKAMIENPSLYGILLVKGRFSNKIQEELDAVTKWFIINNVIDTNGNIITKNDDLANLWDTINDAINRGIIGVFIIAKHKNGILPSHPRYLFNKQPSNMNINGTKYYGFYFRFSELLDILYDNMIEIEDTTQPQSTLQDSSSNTNNNQQPQTG